MSSNASVTQWVLDSTAAPATFVLYGGRKYTVGRGKENDIVVMSLYVSRRHCIIDSNDGHLKIEDLESANGTFLNGVRISPNVWTAVHPLDSIGMGVREITGTDSYIFTVKPVNHVECRNVKKEVKKEPQDDANATVNAAKVKKEVIVKQECSTANNISVIILDDSDSEPEVKKEPVVIACPDTTVIKQEKNEHPVKFNGHKQNESTPSSSKSSSSYIEADSLLPVEELCLQELPSPSSSSSRLNKNCDRNNSKSVPGCSFELTKVLEKLQDTIVGSTPKTQCASSRVQSSASRNDSSSRNSFHASAGVAANVSLGGKTKRISEEAENLVSSTSGSYKLVESGSAGNDETLNCEIIDNSEKSGFPKSLSLKRSSQKPHSKSFKQMHSGPEERWDKRCDVVLGSDNLSRSIYRNNNDSLNVVSAYDDDDSAQSDSSGEIAPVRKKLIGKRKVVVSSSSSDDDDFRHRKKKFRRSFITEKNCSVRKDAKLGLNPVVLVQKVNIPPVSESQGNQLVEQSFNGKNSIDSYCFFESVKKETPSGGDETGVVATHQPEQLTTDEVTKVVGNDQFQSSTPKPVSALECSPLATRIKEEPIFEPSVSYSSNYTSADDIICISDDDDYCVSLDVTSIKEERPVKQEIEDEEVIIDSDSDNEWLSKLSQSAMEKQEYAATVAAETERRLGQEVNQADWNITVEQILNRRRSESEDKSVSSEDEHPQIFGEVENAVGQTDSVAGPSGLGCVSDAQEDSSNDLPDFQITKKDNKRRESDDVSNNSDNSDIFDRVSRPAAEPDHTSKDTRDVCHSKHDKTAKKPSERRVILCDPLPKHKKSASSKHSSSKKEPTRSGSKSCDAEKTSSNKSISSAEKKLIHDERKKKLKEIAQHKKTKETENCQKVKVKALVKNTTLSRADKLVKHMVPSIEPGQTKTKVSSTATGSRHSTQKKESSTCNQSCNSSAEISKNVVRIESETRGHNSTLSRKSKDAVLSETKSRNKGGAVPTSNSDATIPAKKLSFKDLPRIPRLKDTHQSKETSRELRGQTSEEALWRITEPVTSPRGMSVPHLPLLRKGCLVPREKINGLSKHVQRKSVRFQPDEYLAQINYFEIAGFSKLHPVNSKDIPLSRRSNNYYSVLNKPRCSLDPTLAEICAWNIKWLTEQKENTESPPVYQPYTLYPMLTTFCSYADYFKVVHPLMLLSLWAEVVEDSVHLLHDKRTEKQVVYVDSMDEATDNLSLFRCHLLLTQEDVRRQAYPCSGDLCQVDMNVDADNVDYPDVELCSQGINRRIRVFGYVESNYKESYNPTANARWMLVPSPVRPTCKMNLLLKVRKRTFAPQTTMKIKVLAKIKTYLRSFEAVNQLPTSPLCNHILDPKLADFSLPAAANEPLVWKDSLNDDQKSAVLKCARVCMAKEPKICLIQGPPGTGKTKVIVNLVMQILRGAERYQTSVVSKHQRPRILLCAPSNAAIDELVQRLLEVRQALPKEDRFKMVRIGRLSAMRQSVKKISLTELCEKEIKSQNNESIESVQLELQNLDAKRRCLCMCLESAKLRQASTASYEKKIEEIDKKIDHLKDLNGHGQKRSVQRTFQLERDTQKRLLIGADIIATTVTSAYNVPMSEVFASKNKHSPRFTCCIFDEATQCSEPVSLLPLLFGINKFVLVGDPEQLPATVISKEADMNGLKQSLFARICSKFSTLQQSPVLFLGMQYRMHPQICKWPNEYMYGGRIESNRYLCNPTPLKPYLVISLRFQQARGELVNVREAELVSTLAINASRGLPKSMKIAVITPYQKQKQSIMRYLERLPPGRSIEVNTVDSFQGQEVDVAILSCVRTEGIGFLTDSRRLNVAVTRARYSLIICGNFVSLKADKMWNSLLQDARQRGVLCSLDMDDVPPESILSSIIFR